MAFDWGKLKCFLVGHKSVSVKQKMAEVYAVPVANAFFMKWNLQHNGSHLSLVIDLNYCPRCRSVWFSLTSESETAGVNPLLGGKS